MGLLIISIVFGGLLGCLIWLGVGDRLPIQRPEKWPTVTNLLIYTGGFDVRYLHGHLFLGLMK